MGQFFKIGGLTGAAALLIAATPALAGGHMGGAGYSVHRGGVRMAPRAGFAPGRHVGVAPGVRPAPIMRPGPVVGVRPPVAPVARPRFYGPHPGFYGAHGRFGYDYGYALPRRPYYGPAYGGRYGGYAGYGGWPAADLAVTLPAPEVAETYVPYPVYPLGYYGASYAPTGNGVIYNVPPPGPCCGPKIIYLSGSKAHHPSRHKVSVVRGGVVTLE